ncbi:MAG TPA: preprotein translocase subunit YajC [Clostridiaceae bacterium]|nr:preprotein translocase subunit YajC [Clostridiaceae bacterium]
MLQNYTLLLNANADTAQQGGGSLILSLLPMILIFGLMYLLMIRPQKREEKKLKEQINAMRVGDSIVTIGGVVGKIMNISDDEVTIATSVANTMMTFKKQAVSTIVQSEENKRIAEKERVEAGEPEKKSFFDRFQKDKNKNSPNK